MHPNGKWVWVASANGGKGDWRMIKKGTKSGDTRVPPQHQAKQTTQSQSSTTKMPVTTSKKTYKQSDVKQVSREEWNIGDPKDILIIIGTSIDRGYRTMTIKRDGKKISISNDDRRSNEILIGRRNNMSDVIKLVHSGQKVIFDSHIAAVKFAVAYLNSEKEKQE